jgi:hypothetical protein
MSKKTWFKLSGFTLLAVIIFACNKDRIFINTPIYGPTQAFYALSENNSLTAYNAKDVRNAANKVNISGLSASETILSIDFRPATGELYGVSNQSRLYIIGANTGATKPVSANAFTPALNGTIVNLDFNPVTDLIRIITSTGQKFAVESRIGTNSSC